MIKFIWIPCLILIYVVSAYTSYRNNLEGGKFFWMNYAIAWIPIWQLVSRWSNDVFYDSLIFDVVLIASFSITMGILTKQVFGIQQVIALVLMFSGLILFKL
jgi:hypothetical protein